MAEDEAFKLHDGIKDPSQEFDITENLGKGAFGAVYLARYARTGQYVAIKQVQVNEDFMEILKEINIMKQCKSRYVVQYHGNYFKGDMCWIIMEYCAYGSIGDLMNLTGIPLTEPQIALVCRSMLKGLAYLHKSNKIHRDIKPGNVLVTQRGECKLADFGVSGQLSERTRKKNTVIGTPFFLAPEVIMETGYDSRADVWALGISAIEMAELHPPYYDVHPMRVLFLIPSNPSPTLRDPSKFSPEFNDFIRLCLIKDSASRPNAKQLLKHPFILGAGGAEVMPSLIASAQVVIDAHGGRVKALKHLAAQKMKSGEDDEPEEIEETGSPPQADSDSDSDLSDSDDERPHVNANNSNSSNNSTYNSNTVINMSAPSQALPQRNNRASIQELDDLLSGIMAKPATPSTNNSPDLRSRLVSSATTSPLNSPVASRNSFSTPSPAPGAASASHSRLSLSTAPSTNPAPHASSLKPSAPASSSLKTSTPAAELDNILASLSTRPTSSPLVSPKASPTISSSETNLAIPSSPSAAFSSVANGQWTVSTSGGCVNTYRWRLNPQFVLRLPQLPHLGEMLHHVRITLRQFPPDDKLVHIGMYMAKASHEDKKLLVLSKDNALPEVKTTFVKNKSIVSELKLAPGDYVIIPSTFQPGVTAAFELEATFIRPPSDLMPPKLAHIDQAADWQLVDLSSEWNGASAGGCFSPTSSTWRDNPKLLLTVHPDAASYGPATVTILLGRNEQDGASTVAGQKQAIFIGFYIFKAVSKASPAASLSGGNLVGKTSFVNAMEVVNTQQLEPGSYVIIPCTFEPGQASKFTVVAYSSGPLEVLSLIEDDAAVTKGAWAGTSAGGCLNNSTWRSNPQYLLEMSTANTSAPVTLSLEQAPSADGKAPLPFIGFYVARAPAAPITKKIYALAPKDVVGNTEFINDLQVAHTLEFSPANSPWVVIPSTFLPNIETSFTFRAAVSSSESPAPPLRFTRLPDWASKQVTGQWAGLSAAGRYSTSSTNWMNNPRMMLSVAGAGVCRAAVVLSQSEKATPFGIGFYVFKRSPDNVLREVVGKSGFVSGREIAMEPALPAGLSEVLIIPSTFEVGQEDAFTVTVYCEQHFDLQAFSS